MILSLLNIILISFYGLIIYNIIKDWDIIMMLKELLINYSKFNAQAYWFFVTSFIETNMLLIHIYFK